MLFIDNQFVLNAAVAVACYEFFNCYAIDNTTIKWPNDIYWRDRKAGGILIENVLMGNQWKYAIVGIGININQTLFPATIKNAVSLKQITGKTFDVLVLAKELCSYLEKQWQQILHNSYDEVLANYSSHLYKLHQQGLFKKDNATFNAVVKGVTKRGELLIKTNTEATVALDAVEWVLP
jgi:BirA family biotin operon repressor/biotin-[acetyl-CoA-carboxylase] ligase